MADLRRRKPDDDSGKQIDDDTFGASRPDRHGSGDGSDDEQQLLHHKRPTGTLTTADSSDHVNITEFVTSFVLSLFFFTWLIFLIHCYESEKNFLKKKRRIES